MANVVIKILQKLVGLAIPVALIYDFREFFFRLASTVGSLLG